MPSTPKMPKPPPPPKPAPPPPEKPPEVLEDAVESTSATLKKRKTGAKQLRRGKAGIQVAKKAASAGSGLTIK